MGEAEPYDSRENPITPTAHRRRRVLLWLATGTVGLITAGLAASRWVRSPQQVLAETAAPARATLTAAVERRVLRDTVVLRGQVGASLTLEVTPAPRNADRAVVTAVRRQPGEMFDHGSVLLEVAGRPLIVLQGEVPAYRDLRPGMSGKDVAQLQSALKALGHDPGTADGTFGASTKQKLAALYRALGYETPITSDSDAGALTAARRQVTLAQRALADAEQALARLEANPPSPPTPPEPDPVAEARKQVRYAREDLVSARTAQDELERTTGAMLPLSELIFLPSFPARLERLNGGVGSEVKPPLATVSSGELVVRAGLNPGQKGLLRPGMLVQVVSEIHGLTAAGVVATIGDLPQEQAGGGFPMTVTSTQGAFDKRLAGTDVRLTVQAAATDGEVLVVPLSAIFAGADGSTAVLRRDGNASVRVTVTAGVSGDGYVQVIPTEGDLRAGDHVIVGAGGGS